MASGAESVDAFPDRYSKWDQNTKRVRQARLTVFIRLVGTLKYDPNKIAQFWNLLKSGTEIFFVNRLKVNYIMNMDVYQEKDGEEEDEVKEEGDGEEEGREE